MLPRFSESCSSCSSSIPLCVGLYLLSSPCPPQARAAQVQRIRTLFVRQLGVPHASAALTAAQYAAWEGAVAGKEGEEAEAADAEAAETGAAGADGGLGPSDGIPEAGVVSSLPKAVQGAFEKAAAAMEKRKDLEERIKGLQGQQGGEGEGQGGEAPALDAQAQAGLAQAYHVSGTGSGVWSGECVSVTGYERDECVRLDLGVQDLTTRLLRGL